MKLTKEQRDQMADKLATFATGHYLDRMERAAEYLDLGEVRTALLSVRQLYIFSRCKPQGIDGVLWHISARIISHLEQLGFTKQQLNKTYYTIYSSVDLGLKPVPELISDDARSNTN